MQGQLVGQHYDAKQEGVARRARQHDPAVGGNVRAPALPVGQARYRARRNARSLAECPVPGSSTAANCHMRHACASTGVLPTWPACRKRARGRSCLPGQTPYARSGWGREPPTSGLACQVGSGMSADGRQPVRAPCINSPICGSVQGCRPAAMGSIPADGARAAVALNRTCTGGAEGAGKGGLPSWREPIPGGQPSHWKAGPSPWPLPATLSAPAEEDRQEIQQETRQQDELIDQIGDAVQELHAMSKVGGGSVEAGPQTAMDLRGWRCADLARADTPSPARGVHGSQRSHLADGAGAAGSSSGEQPLPPPCTRLHSCTAGRCCRRC